MAMPNPPGFPSPTPTPMPTTPMLEAGSARADRVEEWADDIKKEDDGPLSRWEFSTAMRGLAAILRIADSE